MTRPASDRRRTAMRLLVATRLAAGLVALLAPRALGVLFRTPATAPDLPTRLFGAREIGYGMLLARVRGGTRRTVLGVGLATDLADACVGAASVRRDGGSPSGVAIAVAASAAALLGVVALSPEAAPNA